MLTPAFTDGVTLNPNRYYNTTVVSMTASGTANVEGVYVRGDAGHYVISSGAPAPLGISVDVRWTPGDTTGTIKFIGKVADGFTASNQIATYQIYYKDSPRGTPVFVDEVSFTWFVAP